MERIVTRTAEFSGIENKIFLCKMMKDAEVDVPECEENFAAIMKLTDGKRYAVLVDAREPSTITKEGMENASLPRSYTNLIAQAIVVTSLANRLIGNFMIKFHKPASPTRLFSDYALALGWLREQAQKDKETAAKRFSVMM